MREWAEANYSRLIAQERRETCLHEAFEKVLSDPRLQDEEAGPPKKGWEWKTGYAPRRDISPGKPRPLVAGWISPEAVEFAEWSDPLLGGKTSGLPYKVVRLAALCKAYLDTQDLIIPSEWPDFGAKAIDLTRKADKRDLSAAIAYKGLVDSSYEELVDSVPKELSDQYADKLELYRLTVEAAINKAGAAEVLPEAVSEDASDTDEGKAKDEIPEITWRSVQGDLLRLYEAGKPYTSMSKLAKRLGCSTTLVHKAIHSSSKLENWMGPRPKGSPKVQSLSRVVTDRTLDQSESDPADVLTEDDVDLLMSELILQVLIQS